MKMPETYEEFLKAWIADPEIDAAIFRERMRRAADAGRAIAIRVNLAVFKALTGEEGVAPPAPADPPEIAAERERASRLVEWEGRALREWRERALDRMRRGVS